MVSQNATLNNKISVNNTKAQSSSHPSSSSPSTNPSSTSITSVKSQSHPRENLNAIDFAFFTNYFQLYGHDSSFLPPQYRTLFEQYTNSLSTGGKKTTEHSPKASHKQPEQANTSPSKKSSFVDQYQPNLFSSQKTDAVNLPGQHTPSHHHLYPPEKHFQQQQVNSAYNLAPFSKQPFNPLSSQQHTQFSGLSHLQQQNLHKTKEGRVYQIIFKRINNHYICWYFYYVIEYLKISR